MRLSAQVWFLAAYFGLSTPVPVFAQKKPPANPPPAGATTQQSALPTTSFSMKSPDDDHISCELTEASLLQLRPREEYANLNEMEAEQLLGQVVQAVAKGMDNDNSKQKADFLEELQATQLTSLTMAQAQSRILRVIAMLALASPAQDQIVPENAPQLIDLRKKIKALGPDHNALGLPDVAQKLLNNDPLKYGEFAPLQKAVTAFLQNSEDVKSAIDVYDKAIDELQRYGTLGYETRYRLADADHEYSKLTQGATDPPCAKGQDNSQCVITRFQAHVAKLQGLQASAPAVEAAKGISDNSLVAGWNSIFKVEDIAKAAHKAITAFAKPDDVGCAMTILPWNSMRFIFGQKVADEFLGVQITVRNLNPEKEYLLHGADLAVDMDLSDAKPLHSRFFSGVDKQNVRAYMLAARDYDTRSLFVHSAEGLSTLLGSVAPIWGGVVTDASSVFAGGFLPALTHVWTDSHTEQLNQLNDVGFSASRNDRTFVPKSGSTQFVMFVPARPLEQAWWTQRCVQTIPLGRSTPSLESQTGLDIGAWRRICAAELSRTTLPKASNSPGSMSGTSQIPDAGFVTGSLPYFLPRQIKYRKWTPATYALLKELSFAIVTGTHVTMNSDTHPDISQVDCPHTGVGDLDFSAAQSGVLTCSLSGVNLDKVDHVTLRAATDTQTVDAPLKAANGGKVATVDLNVKDLCPLQKTAYKLYTVTSNGIEDGGTQAIHLSQEPFLTQAPAPSSVTTNPAVVRPNSVSAAPFTLTLTGCHLDDLQSIELGDGAPKTAPLPASGQSAASASIVVGDPTDITLFSKWPNATAASNTVSLSIYLISNTDQSHPQDSKQTLSVTIPPAN